MSIIVFYITHPTEEHARKIAKALIEKQFIACANIHPIHSTYVWEGNIEDSSEWVSICKTSYDNIVNVEMLVQSLHEYKVPNITHWEASSNMEYEQWIFKNVLR